MSTRPDTRHKYKTTAAITVSAVFLITHRCGTSTVCRVRIWFNEWIKPHHGWQSVAILRRGLGGPWPPRFLSGPPACPPSFLLNFTFKFAWLTHTADNFRPAIFYVYVGPPTFFLGPTVAPHFFHSRIATVGNDCRLHLSQRIRIGSCYLSNKKNFRGKA